MKRTAQKYKYNTILLIDDNELDNFINEKILEANFYSKHVYKCTNGKSALEFLQNLVRSGGAENGTIPETIFVDLDMRIMDGFTFIENFMKIKDKGLQNCKIVILTSSINAEDKLKAEKINSDIFFANKPLTNDILNQLKPPPSSKI